MNRYFDVTVLFLMGIVFTSWTNMGMLSILVQYIQKKILHTYIICILLIHTCIYIYVDHAGNHFLYGICLFLDLSFVYSILVKI